MTDHDTATIGRPRGLARWTVALSDALVGDRHLAGTLQGLPAIIAIGDQPSSEIDFSLTSATEPPPVTGQAAGLHVIVTANIDETVLRNAMRTGAAGVIPPDATVKTARAILSAAAAGFFPIPQRLAAALATRLEPPMPASLTERDRVILEHLARGDTVSGIAGRLGCSERHTRRHLRALWDRMGVPGRAQGLVAAARQGLLNP